MSFIFLMAWVENKFLLSHLLDVCCTKTSRAKNFGWKQRCGWESQTRTNGGRKFLVFLSFSTDAFFSISYVLVRKTQLFHFPSSAHTHMQRQKYFREKFPFFFLLHTTHSTIELSRHKTFFYPNSRPPPSLPSNKERTEKFVPRQKTPFTSILVCSFQGKKQA